MEDLVPDTSRTRLRLGHVPDTPREVGRGKQSKIKVMALEISYSMARADQGGALYLQASSDHDSGPVEPSMPRVARPFPCSIPSVWITRLPPVGMWRWWMPMTDRAMVAMTLTCIVKTHGFAMAWTVWPRRSVVLPTALNRAPVAVNNTRVPGHL